MKIPTFRTNTGLGTRAEATTLFSEFIDTFSRKELFRIAEEYVRDRAPDSSVYTFRNLPDGLMGHVIELIVYASTLSAIRSALQNSWLRGELVAHYNFTAESIPPRMLIREAVALYVRFGTVLADLERELITSHPNMGQSVMKAASAMQTPEEAYLMTDGEVDRIILSTWK